MAAPLFVNAGAPDADGFDTTSTPALPGSRVNGNLLIALIVANGTGNARTFTFPAGWTPIGTAISGIHGNSALAWRLVNGSEVAPAITLSGADSLQSQVFQYSGVFGANPIGSVSRTAVTASTTNVTDPGVNVARNNSRVAVFLTGNTSGGATLSTPTGYTADNIGTPSFANINAYSQTTPNVSGNASTPVVSTASASRTNWNAWSVEIASENANANPTVSTSAAVTFYEGDSALVIAADMVVADPDGGNLASGVVSITSNFHVQDVLSFTNQNGISGSYNSGTGVLTLTGSSSIANYQTALRSITYENAAAPATSGVRTVSFQVNDGSANSNTDTATIDVQAITPGSTLTTTPGAGSTTCPPYWAIEIEIWAGGQAGDHFQTHGNLGLLTTCSTFGLTANPATVSFSQGAFFYGFKSGLPGAATGGDVNIEGQRGGYGGKSAGGDGGIGATISPNQGGNSPFGGLGGAALPPVTGTLSGNDGALPGAGGSGVRSAGFGIAFGGWFATYSAGGTGGSYCKKRFVRGEGGAPAFGSTINFNIGAGGARTANVPPVGIITSGAGANGGFRITVFGFDDLAPDEGGDSDTSDDPIDLGVGSVEIISPNTPPRERDTLRAEYQGDDPDSSTGYGTNITIRWLADGVAITGATAMSVLLTGAEVGKVITVEATYTDFKGFRDVVTSTATAAVVIRSLPLDDIDPADVFAAYSVKLLRRAYTGPLIRLFHGSTNNEQDFYPKPGEEGLDHDEIRAWRVSEGHEFVWTCYATIYDQSGNGRHISGLNVAHAFAPIYASYGDTTNFPDPYKLPSGYPAPLFDGSRDFTRLALVGPTSALGFLAVVLRDDSEPGRVFRWDYSGDTAQEVGFRLTTTVASDWADNAAALYGHGATAGAGPRAIANGSYAENDEDAVIWEGELSSSRRAIRRNGVTQSLNVNVASTFTPIASGKLVVGPNTASTNKTSMLAELVIFNNDIHGALGPLRIAAAQAFLLGDVSAPTADDLNCNFTDDDGVSEAIITVTIPFECHFTDDEGVSEATITINLAYQARFTDDEGMEAIPTITVKELPPPVQTVVVILGAG